MHNLYCLIYVLCLVNSPKNPTNIPLCLSYTYSLKIHTHTNKQKESPITLMHHNGTDPLHLYLSLHIDKNGPYTLFIIDDRAVTSHQWPLGAALTSTLSPGTPNDHWPSFGIHLMTPEPDKGQWWKVKSGSHPAAVTLARDRNYWLTNWTVNWGKRNWVDGKWRGSGFKD